MVGDVLVVVVVVVVVVKLDVGSYDGRGVSEGLLYFRGRILRSMGYGYAQTGADRSRNAQSKGWIRLVSRRT
jgi:hypothetical protein